MEQLLAEQIQKENLSDSMLHRVEILLDTAWDADGYLLTKLSRMVKILRQKTEEPLDFAALLTDMLYWNQDNQNVQQKWAHAIFGIAQ